MSLNHDEMKACRLAKEKCFPFREGFNERESRMWGWITLDTLTLNSGEETLTLCLDNSKAKGVD